MISVLNYKQFDRGAIKGFFDFRYHGLVVKGVRLMAGDNGLWIALPQRKGKNADGEVQYFDQMYLTPPEAEHVRQLVLADLRAQRLINTPPPQNDRNTNQQQSVHRTPEGEDVSENYYDDADDDIPF